MNFVPYCVYLHLFLRYLFKKVLLLSFNYKKRDFLLLRQSYRYSVS